MDEDSIIGHAMRKLTFFTNRVQDSSNENLVQDLRNHAIEQTVRGDVMDADPNRPIICRRCGTHFTVLSFPRKELAWLEDWYFYVGYKMDAAILPRMPSLFERHPEIAAFYLPFPDEEQMLRWREWARTKEPVDDWLESEATKVLANGIPFLESDRELVDYLRRHFFWYPGYSKRVAEEIKRLERQLVTRLGGQRVSCPECKSDLDLDREIYGHYVPIIDVR
jgi:hypothetical protein